MGLTVTRDDLIEQIRQMQAKLRWLELEVAKRALSGDGPGQPPTGAAGGELAGSYPDPTLADSTTKGDLIGHDGVGSARVPVGADNKVLTAKAADAEGVSWEDTQASPPTGAAGGDLTGTYPNPGIGSGVIVNDDVAAGAAIAYSKLNLMGFIVDGDIAGSGITTRSKLPTEVVYDDETNTFSLKQTFSGEVEIADHIYQDAIVTATASVDPTVTTIDLGTGNYHKVTFGAGNAIFAFTAPGGAGAFTLILKQDATGGRTATWPATVDWVGGIAPVLSTGANAIDAIVFLYDTDASRYLGQPALDFS